MYGKKAFKAKIVKVWGHQIFDVQYYSDSTGKLAEKEVGVPVSRIIPIAAAFKMKRYGPFGSPFVSIPMNHRYSINK